MVESSGTRSVFGLRAASLRGNRRLKKKTERGHSPCLRPLFFVSAEEEDADFEKDVEAAGHQNL